MDTGIFLSSKKRFLFLCLGPALFIIPFYLLASVYTSYSYKMLQRRLIQAELAPLISEKISAAQQILKEYEVTATKADIIQMLNEQLEEMANKTNFNVSLMTVEPKGPQVAAGGISIFKARVRGSGSFASVIKFFNETYKSGRLFSVEKASLRVASFELPYTYEADFEFFYHAVCK